MDRPLDPDLLKRRAWRLAAKVTVGVVVAGWLALSLPAWLGPSIPRSRVRLGVVDVGRVEGVITATGLVEPALERVVSSPVEALVLGVLRRAGESVDSGDSIVQLDLTATRLAVERSEEQVVQKAHAIERQRRQTGENVAQLADELEGAGLDLEIATFQNQQEDELFAEGLTSEAKRRSSQVALRKAELAVRSAERELAAARREGEADSARLRLELEILTKERDEAAGRLERATAQVEEAGVLTWVLDEAGITVPRGAVLARVADLEVFRVEATVSDLHAGRLAVGQPVRVRVGRDELLSGRIEAVHPAIENGEARFSVELDDPSHLGLRAQLRVDVFVASEGRDGVLRVPRSSFLLGEGRARDLFVEVEGELVRRPVELGLVGRDFVEILSGLEVGERVALSDLRDYQHLSSIRLK